MENDATETDRQDRWNRQLLAGVCVYVVLGFTHNALSASTNYVNDIVGLMGFFLFVCFGAAFVGVGSYGMMKNLPNFESWGYVINRRLWVSVALIGLAVLMVAVGISTVPLAFIASAPIKALMATLEETFMRGILLSSLLALARPKSQWGVAGLIIAAAVVFGVVHIPRYGYSGAQNAFFAAIILGYIFYWTRSVLFPAFMHAMANAGAVGGVVAILVYFLVAGVARQIVRSRQTAAIPPVPTLSKEP